MADVHDVVVDDDYYSDIYRGYLLLNSNMNARVEEYIEILNDIYTNGICAGNIHDNLLLYIEKIKVLQESINDMTELAYKNMKLFLESIDETDAELY